MKKFTLLICIAFVFSFQKNGLAVQFDRPESVVHDVKNNRYLISNVGNGDIVAQAMDGTLSVFNNTASASIRGITLPGDTLFAAGDEGLLGFDLATGNNILTVAIPEGNFLNDIAADTSGYVYISDGAILYQIDPVGKTYSQYLTNLSGSNGIFFDKRNNRMLVTQENPARISAINLADKSIQDLANVPGKWLDGLAMDENGRVYVTSWETHKAYQFEPDFSNAGTEIQSTHNGPADLCYDFVNHALVIPNMNINTVSIVEMPYVKLLSPNGGESWEAGSNQNITWEMRHVEKVKLEYSLDNGGSFTSIVESTDANAGELNWTLPETVSTACIIRITDLEDGLLTDISEGVFAFVAPPLVNLELFPEDTLISRDQTFQLIAMGYDNSGKEMEFIAKWSATGGTITPGGVQKSGNLVTAQTAEFLATEIGDHIIVCADSITGISDTTWVTIVTPTGIFQTNNTSAFLAQNYPNPFSQSTIIEYCIPLSGGVEAKKVTLKVFDLNGKEIAVPVNKKQNPGIYRFRYFINEAQKKGIYYYQLSLDNKIVSTKKMLVK